MAAGSANKEFQGAGKWDLKVKMKVKLREVAECPFPGCSAGKEAKPQQGGSMSASQREIQ